MASVIGVQCIPRPDFYNLWGLYTIAFFLYAVLVFSKQNIPVYYGLILAVLCRMIGFALEPLLSDDYFRFVWDGMVMNEGINPAAYTPAYLLSHPEISNTNRTLYELLNSKEYYSVYPPVAQLIFFVSFAINQLNIEGHIIFYKVILFFADIGIIYLLAQFLKKEQKSLQNILIYALNPLVIIEYTGNLHMEGLMIVGLLAAIFFAKKRSWILSIFFMTFSVCAKVITIMLTPFMPREMYWKKIILWGIGILSLTAFIFFMTFHTNNGWLRSIMLWFQSFEFNASFYYIIQNIYSAWKGYENITIVGPMMGAFAFMLIAATWIYYLRKKEMHWSTAMVIALTIYFLLTTTLHPWYLGTLLALSIISGHRFPIIWTYLVFLSYSHYSDGGFSEKYGFITLEYFLLFAWMIFEFRNRDFIKQHTSLSATPN
ncbi:MAG TPA: hypothetical protein VMZ69_03790 [Saprospiraceae bacterium]|nr:hypothetical protein [Saprospiraceae bacterium]